MIKMFNPPGLNPPAGHYSHAVVHNGIAYLAGQLPSIPGKPPGNPGSIAEQTAQVLANIEQALEACGSSRNKVLRCTVYISDIAFWPEINRVWGEFFGSHKPARAVIPVNELHYGYALEVEVTAAVG